MAKPSTPAAGKRNAERFTAPPRSRLRADAIDWSVGADPNTPWIPQTVVPLWGTNEFDALTPDQRLRYNHYYALEMVEQFVWIENHLILKPLSRRLARLRPGSDLHAAADRFVNDEHHHSAALTKLLRTGPARLVCPVWGQVLLAPPVAVELFGWMLTKCPVWPLVTSAFEEHTLLLARHYRQAEGKVSPLFAQIHGLHAQDEGRHCIASEKMADTLIQSRGRLSQWVWGWVLRRFLAAYYDLDWGYDLTIRQLVKDLPELTPRQDAMIRAAKAAPSTDFFAALFGTSATPVNARLLDRYPIFAAAIDGLGQPSGRPPN